jgi:hypothetical protein
MIKETKLFLDPFFIILIGVFINIEFRYVVYVYYKNGDIRIDYTR